MQEIRHEFLWKTVESWKGERIDSMTISYGIVSSREKEWESVHEIAHAADIRMYEKKAMYYSRNGVDRRGQPAAYIALCKLYPKGAENQSEQGQLPDPELGTAEDGGRSTDESVILAGASVCG